VTAIAPRSAGLSRAAGILLVVIECLTLALLEHGYLFAALASGFALLSLVDRLRIDPRQVPHWLWFAVVGLLLAVKHRLAPEPLPEQITFFNTSFAYELARFLIFLQVAQLYVRRPGDRLPAWIAGVACLAIVFASNVRLNPATRGTSLALCLAFAAGFALYSSAARRRVTGRGSRLGGALVAGVLAIATVTGFGAIRVLSAYEDDLERWLAGRGLLAADEVTTGFSGRGFLGDISGWKQHQSHEIALRVDSSAAPGYLRGMVFDSYYRGRWADSAAGQVRSLTGLKLGKARRPGELVYWLTSLTGPPDDDGETLDVWPAAANGEFTFLPLEASHLGTASSAIGLAQNTRIIRHESPESPYTVWQAPEVAEDSLADWRREELLAVDPELREQLRPLAEEVCGGVSTTAEKLDRVRSFFHQNFSYELGARKVRERDPVEHFLTDRPPGHCEYFASSAAILLRVAGVPTRYITGYVAAEHNTATGYWLARRRDAHAWVEAYDDELGRWVTVETTPPAGVPESRDQSRWDAWWDSFQHGLDRWRTLFSQEGFVGTLREVLAWLLTPAGIAVLLSLIGVAVWRRRRAWQRTPGAVARQLTPRRLRIQLDRADRLAGRAGFRREPKESLSQFAARLRASKTETAERFHRLADWYDAYVRVRYTEPDSPTAAGELETRFATVR
jgi:hypothetical protein